MPGPSFGLPARKACPREFGSICEDCYADDGCYRFSGPQNALAVRFKWTIESMRTIEGFNAWVNYVVEAIRASGCEYFRVHDSGDVFNPAYARAWLAVCQHLPEVKFWIPTRAYQQSGKAVAVFAPILHALRQLAQLPNVTVRPSALNFGDCPPKVEGLHAGTTADNPDVFRVKQCPAKSQGGRCGDCRTCWDDKTCPVSYARHGRRRRKVEYFRRPASTLIQIAAAAV
jgi:hypothetical protein